MDARRGQDSTPRFHRPRVLIRSRRPPSSRLRSLTSSSLRSYSMSYLSADLLEAVGKLFLASISQCVGGHKPASAVLGVLMEAGHQGDEVGG